MTSAFDMLCDPTISDYQWWHLAAMYPIDAPKTILGELFLLENPSKWGRFVANHGEDWLQTHLSCLPPHYQQHLAADCNERILSYWQSTDTRPLEAIKARQALLPEWDEMAFVQEQRREKWHLARVAARQAAVAMAKNYQEDIRWQSYYSHDDEEKAFAQIFSRKFGSDVERARQWTVAYLASLSVPWDTIKGTYFVIAPSERYEQVNWQWQRFLYYLERWKREETFAYEQRRTG